MPIKIPEDLPAYKILEDEGVLVIKDTDAMHQDIRPLKIALLNLMPEKIKTETQISRVLGNSPLQIELTLLSPSSYIPKNTSREHMLDFYQPWKNKTTEKFDGLIITGAPVEQMEFEAVDYWKDLCEVFDWTTSNVHGVFNLCWGAQAALYHFYNIKKYVLDQKRFGIFCHTVCDHSSMLTKGLNDIIKIPTSRYSENRHEDISEFPNLEILIESEEAGLCLVHDRKLRHVHMFNHLEYDSDTLNNEYKRDLIKNKNATHPLYYFENNDKKIIPPNTWRSSGHLLFGNWLNYIYQTTPYDTKKIGENSDPNPFRPRSRPGARIG